MNEKPLSDYNDQELLEESKKARLSPIYNAVFIGFLAGILIFSFTKNNLGLVALIPLFLIYKLVQSSKKNDEVDSLLKERNLS